MNTPDPTPTTASAPRTFPDFATPTVAPAATPPRVCRPLGGRRALSVWETGQRTASAQRGQRYVADTLSHPGRMLPAVAAYAIEALTRPGELVLDPMCGAGTTVVEAMYLGRPVVGIDVEPRWVSLARANIAHTLARGVRADAQVLIADSRGLPHVLAPEHAAGMRGRVSLVLTSPPYGPGTHGQVRAEPGEGVSKTDFRYSGRGQTARNLAYQPLHRLTAGLGQILAGCVPLLGPGGMIAITTRPWREYGELIDLPDLVTLAAVHAGLIPIQRCAALLGRLDEDQVIDRASFFQRTTVNKARDTGLAWHLICHEDVIVLRARSAGSAPGKAGRRPHPRRRTPRDESAFRGPGLPGMEGLPGAATTGERGTPA